MQNVNNLDSQVNCIRNKRKIEGYGMEEER